MCRKLSGMTRLPPEPLELAVAQCGVVARWQLRRWLSLDAIDGRVRHGALDRLARGVYRLPGTGRPEQAPIAAALRAGPRAVLTGPFVLAHRRLDGFDLDAPFEVLLPRGRHLGAVDFACRPDPLPARSHDLLGDVRLASPVDALLESALFRSTVGDRPLRVARDQLGWRGLLTAADLRDRIEARGETDAAVRAFLAAMGDHDLRSESEGERDLGSVLCRLDPAPEPQVWVTPLHRLDWYLRLLRLGWEYQGKVDHGGRAGRRRDAVRDREVAGVGIRLLYVTAADLRDRAALIAMVMGVIAARADELGVEAPRLRPAA